MAKSLLFSSKATVYLLLLAITIGCATSSRILDEVDPQPGVVNPLPTPVQTGVQPQPNNPATSLPSGQIPALAPVIPPVDDNADPPLPEVDAGDSGDDSPQPNTNQPAVPLPAASAAPIAGPTTTSPVGSGLGATAASLTPTAGPATTSPVGSGPGATTAGVAPGHPTLSFYMHDIIGGSHPTARIVTGLVASTISNVPFTKANNNIFPVSGGTPLTTANVNGIVDNNRNNLPFLAGLNGQGASGFTNTETNTFIQNSGNNNIVAGGTSQPFVTAGQLPSGSATLQKLMFGSVTVIDDELTEQHELGSAVIGRAQGFYLASSLDGNSHTMVMTVMVHGGDHGHQVEDAISLFGVHRTATPVSHVAVIGGTGKYENAQGYATVESLPQVNQHTTDGVDTIMHINIYLSE
ncbi:hypothetical protein TIFTF001_026450 [Ficus carica]|uniref:Dirigent protein n=1 Tax=Ficus carica TaxID=3494 RepID=A0AA88DL90_FICCA|nr:hypothetical protein TIFTF001_026450 [Ficus carica]